MRRPARASRRRPAEQVLKEAVLAALGRPGVGLDAEHLLADERDEQGLELVLVGPGTAASACLREGLAEHGAVLEQPPLLRGRPSRRAAISAWSVSGTSSVSIGPVGRYAAPPGRAAAVEQHAHGLDRVERDALGAVEDLLAQRLRQARDEAARSSSIASRGAARGRASVKFRVTAPQVGRRSELGPRERETKSGELARPLEQVLDEVEQRRVRPLHVLEDEHRRVHARRAARRRTARRRTGPRGRRASPPRGRAGAQPRLDEAPLLRVRDVLVDVAAELRERRAGSSSSAIRARIRTISASAQ